MSQLECDSKSGGVSHSAAKRIQIDPSENESDTNNNRSLKSVERAVAQEIDLQHRTLHVTLDAGSEPLTADYKLIESENMSSSFDKKDSSVGESSIVDCLSSVSDFVDKLPSSHQSDLRQHVMDISTETCLLHPDDGDAVSRDSSAVTASRCSDDVCQLQASEPTVLEQRDSSEQCTKSSQVIASSQTTDHSEDSTELNTPSTGIVISAHQNKDSYASCQADLDCASTDVAESDCVSSSVSDKVPQSTADLHMCCNDDNTSVNECCSVLSNNQQNENAYSSLTQSHNGTDRISNDSPAIKHVTLKQRTTANGMDSCVNALYLSVLSL